MGYVSTAVTELLLLILPLRLNFINVLRTAFAPADPESVKNTDDLTVFFTLLGSTGVKAVCKSLVKLTPSIYNREDKERAFKLCLLFQKSFFFLFSLSFGILLAL